MAFARGSMLARGKFRSFQRRTLNLANVTPKVSSSHWLRGLFGAPAQEEDVDVLIVGAGMVGAATACGIASHPMLQGQRVVVVDGKPLGPSFADISAGSDVPDPRVVAVTPATIKFLEEVGAWDLIKKHRHSPFDSMQVWDHAGSGFVRYDAQEINHPVLGYVVENNVLVAALQERLQALKDVEVIAPSTLESIHWSWRPSSSLSASSSTFQSSSPGSRTNESGAQLDLGGWGPANGEAREDDEALTGGSGRGTSGGRGIKNDWARVELSSGRVLRARLVVGADGGRSKVRQLAGLRTIGWGYHQRAVISTVEVAAQHTTAWQRFLPNGPIALLPCGAHFSNIVWSTTDKHAQELVKMDAPDFIRSVNDVLQTRSPPSPNSQYSGHSESGNSSYTRTPLGSTFSHSNILSLLSLAPRYLSGPLSSLSESLSPLGSGSFQNPPAVTGAPGRRYSFPLTLAHAGRYVGPRLALVGDAAHIVHPLAGQGVNLGFGDAENLAATLGRGARTGADIGELSLLEEYEKERQKTNLTMMAALDGLQKVFAVQWGPFGAARNLGLDAVRRSPMLKKKIMGFAMGD